MEKRELPLVAVSIANKFGGAFEDSKIKGIAHLIEHLVFTGTKTRTQEDIASEIEKKGGILNAFTANEVTSYWFKLPSEHIFAGLDILSDMLNNPTFDPIKFEKEKRVILEEIKMYHDNPRTYVFEKIEENLYAKPFGEGIIGSHETVSALTRDFVVDFFERNYNPENYIVTIVGNADFNKICQYLEKTFKKGKGKPKHIPIVKLIKEDRIEKRDGIDQAHFVFAMPAPLFGSKEYYALEVLDAYLGDGMSSKLFLKIREERGLAYAVKSAINAEKNYSYYTVYAGTKAEAIPEIKKIILEEFGNIKNMSKKDFEEAKQKLIGNKRVFAEDSSNVMNTLLFSEIAGNAKMYYEYEKNIKKVKIEDVKKVSNVKEYTSVALLPK